MFEGSFPHRADAHPGGDTPEGESLRSLSWSELVARLSAARELRTALSERAHASFDAGSARCIAAQHNSDHAINLDDSTYRKGPQGKGQAVTGAENGVARN
jgi:hypothetical protein